MSSQTAGFVNLDGEPDNPGRDFRLRLGCLRVLFGYAHSHPLTGGLSWLSSSEVLELDRPAGLAKTRSGRCYRLGRRFDPLDVGAETAGARLAFELLLGSEFDGMDRLRKLDRICLQT